ncbi:iron-siderophore ABC transporter substrate-binding protein [Thermomonospora umbrina]|uniref:Iron complex transport system substrate-binding protein n=1 Tax=Thermomonospora umbrina TaxID=111806 RepID=A0A3D9T0Z3_9ACTN|nr:iron-siderophore ABC transporter substrate-binding protein [Thermomonospora umbrina]REF00004.1 iron complex transport system substrate-binding protein [Thermomonospora umbrina]
MSPTSLSTARPPAARRVALALAAVLLLALGLSACGGEKDGSGGDGRAAPGAAGLPIRIEHKYGTTEIKSPPKRVVTVGWTDQDAVLALGIKPVGVVEFSGLGMDIDKFPWSSAQWGGTKPTVVGAREDFKMEKIAQLKPDLIIGLYTGMKKEQYDTLSKLAPTVAQSAKYADYAMPWKDMTLVTGRALGKESQARQLIAAVDKRFADVRQKNPQLVGKTFAVADPFKPGQYAVFGAGDAKVEFMKSLGLTLPEAIAKAAGTAGAAVIGSERLNLVEVDRLVFLTSVPNAQKVVEGDKVYTGLKVAKEKRVVFVPYNPTGAAVSFNTVLSIPYAIDQMVPLLTSSG